MENFLKLMAFAHKKEAAHSQEKTDHVQLIKKTVITMQRLDEVERTHEVNKAEAENHGDDTHQKS